MITVDNALMATRQKGVVSIPLPHSNGKEKQILRDIICICRRFEPFYNFLAIIFKYCQPNLN
jgi:hypothetical protein